MFSNSKVSALPLHPICPWILMLNKPIIWIYQILSTLLHLRGWTSFSHGCHISLFLPSFIFPFFSPFPPLFFFLCPIVFHPWLSPFSAYQIFLCTPAGTGCGQNALSQFWQWKMFLPASLFFGKKQKRVERQSSICETIRVTSRK